MDRQLALHANDKHISSMTAYSTKQHLIVKLYIVKSNPHDTTTGAHHRAACELAAYTAKRRNPIEFLVAGTGCQNAGQLNDQAF